VGRCLSHSHGRLHNCGGCLAVAKDLTSWAQSSRLAVFGGRGMSFNICRGTLGSLVRVMLTRV
jgi:hypothetical protein